MRLTKKKIDHKMIKIIKINNRITEKFVDYNILVFWKYKTLGEIVERNSRLPKKKENDSFVIYEIIYRHSC